MVTLIAVSLGVHQKMGHSDLVLLAMTGLLHDIGELYIDPVYLNPGRALKPEEWKHVVAHPRIGQIALSELTTYPRMVIEAVGNHHERLDGSGYPRQLSGQQINPITQILSMAEMLSGIIMRKGDVLNRSCLALKCIPGEHPRDLISVVSGLKRNYSGAPFPSDDIAAQTVPKTKRCNPTWPRASKPSISKQSNARAAACALQTFPAQKTAKYSRSKSKRTGA